MVSRPAVQRGAPAGMYPPLLAGSFVCSCGYLRSGKTMNAVRIAELMHKAGWPVASNIEISFASRRLRTVEDLEATRGHVIVIDEVQATLDSREFARNVNLSREGILFGKRANVVLMTTPHFGMLDIRWRQLTEWVFICRKVFFDGNPFSKLELYWYPGVGDLMVPRGKWLMEHTRMYGKYNTWDEDFTLEPEEKPNVGRNKR